MTSLVFFGSFQRFSTITLDRLIKSGLFTLNAVVTTPPRPADKGIITQTDTHHYCEQNHLPVFPLENLDIIPPEIARPDFVLVSGYGKLLPQNWINFPKVMAVNVHQSLLPDYAGRFPAEWAILNDETKTGVTLIQMSPHFDKGDILAQSVIPISSTDTRDTLYQKLYELSADIFIKNYPLIINQTITHTPQNSSGFYARQITKDDGYFTTLDHLDKMIRALNPWPGVWTYVTDQKGNQLKMKVLSIKANNQQIELDKVLIEGKKPTTWSEISSHYSLPVSNS